jgi:hypothetical protein
MKASEFRDALKLAVLSLATRFNRTFDPDEVELNEYIDDLIFDLSVGQMANIPKALSQWRREERFFPQTGEIRGIAKLMPIDEKYLTGPSSRYGRLLQASINGSGERKTLPSIRDDAAFHAELQKLAGVTRSGRQPAPSNHTTGETNVKERTEEKGKAG